MNTPSTYLSVDQARHKLQAYCAYQERCHQEVAEKMHKMGLPQLVQDELILELLRDNYLNEERFARAYARGKFRIKQYGRTRIKQELQRKQIGAKLIELALTEIDPDDYYDTLQSLAQRIADQTREPHPYKKRKKCIDFLLRKGYELDLILDVMPSVLQASDEESSTDFFE